MITQPVEPGIRNFNTALIRIDGTEGEVLCRDTLGEIDVGILILLQSLSPFLPSLAPFLPPSNLFTKTVEECALANVRHSDNTNFQGGTKSSQKKGTFLLYFLLFRGHLYNNTRVLVREL